MTQNSSKVLTVRDLVARVAATSNVPQKDVKPVLDALGIVTTEELKNKTDIRLPGIGTLTAKYRSPRTQHSIHTGKTVEIPGKTVPSIRWKQSLKDELTNKG